MNGCAPGLALTERLKATRKWAIRHIFLVLEKRRFSLSEIESETH